MNSMMLMLAAAGIFVEAESFTDRGGWTLETQSVRQMGSAYLMAHGMGAPVADAATSVEIPEKGTYTVWVRTRNWVEEWAPGQYPGRFQILVNGEALKTELGTNGKNWAWQKAGEVTLAKGKAMLALHDLTGFNGRCDAVALMLTGGSNAAEQLRVEFQSRPPEEDPGEYDLVVVGGGVSGICASLAASRMGLKTLTLHDRGKVGGCNSSEVRVCMGGVVGVGPYPNLGNVVKEIQPLFADGNPHEAEFFEDDRKEIAFRIKKDYKFAKWLPGTVPELRHYQYVDGVETNAGRIVAVIARDMLRGTRRRIRAKLFCDATGDAVIARLAGCETMYGREERARFHEASAPEKAVREVMGMSLQWLSEERAEDAPFPDISAWALKIDNESGTYNLRGSWDWENGFYRDMAEETETIRDYGLLSVFSNWHWMKNVSPRKAEFRRQAFKWISPLGGKRESHRVVGDYVFNQNDLHNHTDFKDATACATWNIDFHFPDPRFAGKFPEPFRSAAYHRGYGDPQPVPYRSLYARDVANLFLAGRHISVSHAAFASVRVQRTLGALAEVTGLAAAIARKHDCTPRMVYEKYLDELKASMKKGVPDWGVMHSGGAKIGENYDFNVRGKVSVDPSWGQPLDPQVADEIKSLGYQHMNEHLSFQDRRRRLILADESRAFLHYYDSFDRDAGYSVKVEKPVWDLKEVGDMKFRTVCEGGFQVTDMKARKVVENFRHPSISWPYVVTAVCDLKDGGFIASVNPQKETADFQKAILLRRFNAAKELVATYRLEGFYYARSMQWDREEDVLLLAWEKGFARVKLPEKVEGECEVLADFRQPKGRNLFDVVPEKNGEGYLAGCGYGGGLVHFNAEGKSDRIWFVPTDTGKESRFYAQVSERPDGHIFMAHWTGHGEKDSYKGVQAVEFDENGKAIWQLDSPDRFGSISGVIVIE